MEFMLVGSVQGLQGINTGSNYYVVKVGEENG